jgi:hypothetical protein
MLFDGQRPNVFFTTLICIDIYNTTIVQIVACLGLSIAPLLDVVGSLLLQ